MIHILNQTSTAISDLNEEEIIERMINLQNKLEKATEDKDLLIIDLQTMIDYVNEKKTMPTINEVLDKSAQIMALIQRQRVCVDNILLLEFVQHKNKKI